MGVKIVTDRASSLGKSGSVLLEATSERLGHSDSGITADRYLHVFLNRDGVRPILGRRLEVFNRSIREVRGGFGFLCRLPELLQCVPLLPPGTLLA